jgi:hypothetical protein
MCSKHHVSFDKVNRQTQFETPSRETPSEGLPAAVMWMSGVGTLLLKPPIRRCVADRGQGVDGRYDLSMAKGSLAPSMIFDAGFRFGNVCMFWCIKSAARLGGVEDFDLRAVRGGCRAIVRNSGEARLLPACLRSG